MSDRRQGLSDADFDELKRKRDESIRSVVDAFCEKHGWDRNKATVPSHDLGATCYCACPDGPCQHEFEGWREFDDGHGGEKVCKRCGLGAMSHDLRFMP